MTLAKCKDLHKHRVFRPLESSRQTFDLKLGHQEFHIDVQGTKDIHSGCVGGLPWRNQRTGELLEDQVVTGKYRVIAFCVT